jgi:hypothetical protein
MKHSRPLYPCCHRLFIAGALAMIVCASGRENVCAQTAVLTAVDSDSIRMISNQNYADNNVRAYTPVSGDLSDKVDGFMKFDLSSIPDAATITSMRLVTYSMGLYASPRVRVYRVSGDGWSRASTGDVHPGLDEVLTLEHTSFSSESGESHDWVLNVGATTWTGDLLDNTLSLALHNEQSSYSYTYWWGSDLPATAPVLLVNWGSTCGYAVAGDVNDDCRVDLGDMAVMAGKAVSENN